MSDPAPIQETSGGNVGVATTDPHVTTDARSNVICRATLSADVTSLAPNASFIKIALDTPAFDTLSAFDATNFRYTAKSAGHYQVNLGISIAALHVLAAQYRLAIYKNGSLVSNGPGFKAIVSTLIQLSFTDIVQLNKTDYVEMFLYGAGDNSSNQLTITSGLTETFMSVHRVAD